ncbi:hypothetical protein, partial [Nocardioides lentus]|uniref:hypothetical protein n=1 Tax=Nocardioides lentus TaxID=338077 RepID=UPI0031D06C17
MLELSPGDLLVARLWRWDAERLARDAKADRAEQVAEGESDPDYSVSTFAVQADAGESVEATKSRLIEYATATRSAKWITYTTKSRLEEA